MGGVLIPPIPPEKRAFYATDHFHSISPQRTMIQLLKILRRLICQRPTKGILLIFRVDKNTNDVFAKLIKIRKDDE